MAASPCWQPLLDLCSSRALLPARRRAPCSPSALCRFPALAFSLAMELPARASPCAGRASCSLPLSTRRVLPRHRLQLGHRRRVPSSPGLCSNFATPAPMALLPVCAALSLAELPCRGSSTARLCPVRRPSPCARSPSTPTVLSAASSSGPARSPSARDWPRLNLASARRPLSLLWWLAAPARLC
jgi:hypothetical protein